MWSNQVSKTFAAPVNKAPAAMEDQVAALEDKAMTINVLSNDTDADGDTLTVSALGFPASGTATTNGISITYTPHADFAGTDTFSYTVKDTQGATDQATVTITVTADTEIFPIEIGEVHVDHTWRRVNFQKTYVNPIVIANPLSYNDHDPAVVRIKNVDTTGFNIRVQEWDYLDDIHGTETVGYMVMERGRYTLSDGTIVDASSFKANDTGTFHAIPFSQPFQSAPVVLTSVTSFNQNIAKVMRLRNVNTQGFQYQLQRQERRKRDRSRSNRDIAETITYIAWEASAGTLNGLDFVVSKTQDVITHNFQTILYPTVFIDLPVFLADMQTTDSADTASIRWDRKDFYGVDIQIDEEQSYDRETNHTTEVVGYILLANNDASLDTDGDQLTNIDEITLYDTDPAVADTDTDGIDDGDEVAFWSDTWQQDADNDGLINLLDPDADNDGTPDGSEIRDGFDPTDPNSRP